MMAIDPMNLIQLILAEGKNSILTVHSYKGGTGKTLLSVNMAVMSANKGKKTCLLDLDFRAPSLNTIFKNEDSEYWLNDYLNGACEIDQVLRDCSSYCIDKGKLFVGFANPSVEAIREMASKDRKWEMNALCRLLALKKMLKNFHFDLVIFDSSPGLEYSSINAVVSADLVLVTTTLNESDIEGTQRMLKDVNELFEKKTGVILNKMPASDYIPIEKRERKLKLLQLPLLGTIPCSCDIPDPKEEFFFAFKNPYHVLTRKLQEIAAKIE